MCANKSPLTRFIESMKIDFEKWHDGVGYDLKALSEANREERVRIERILIKRNPLDWRDIEALAVLDSHNARAALRYALQGGSNEVNMAILRFAPELVDNELKSKLIVRSLKTATFYYGLLQTFYIVEKYHPEEVIRELFNGLLNREGGVAPSFAAMLFYIYGKDETYFPWDRRDFFLKFNTSNSSDRQEVFKELCEKIDVDYRIYLQGD
jgi:hypothetical protein